MTRIYTKTGDAGETGLFGGGRVPKDDDRVDAYGEVDELNAALGLARSMGVPPELEALLATLQDQLFTVGAALATPRETKASAYIPPLKAEWIADMERHLDAFAEALPPLTSFILPGGSKAASALHLARTVCRRAERRVVPLMRAGEVDAQIVVFLNRLSDLLFSSARMANLRAGVQDVAWVPRKG
jgi:cob(I)alamin adenosyltransferase